MSSVDRLADTFAREGCTGMTIWVLGDGRYQVSLRRADRTSWCVAINNTLPAAITQSLALFYRQCAPSSSTDFSDITG